MYQLPRIFHNDFNHPDTGDTERKTYVTNLLIRSFTVCLSSRLKNIVVDRETILVVLNFSVSLW